jgi:hypothetical protein
MIKYIIPENIKEIIIKEGIPFAYQRILKLINNKWRVKISLIKLEEKNA